MPSATPHVRGARTTVATDRALSMPKRGGVFPEIIAVLIACSTHASAGAARASSGGPRVFRPASLAGVLRDNGRQGAQECCRTRENETIEHHTDVTATPRQARSVPPAVAGGSGHQASELKTLDPVATAPGTDLPGATCVTLSTPSLPLRVLTCLTQPASYYQLLSLPASPKISLIAN